MGLYKIEWKSSSRDDFKKIDHQYIPKILSAIESLADDPRPIKSKKLIDSEKTYRIRIGNYRVVYQIDDKTKIISIYHVRHRKDIYRA